MDYLQQINDTLSVSVARNFEMYRKFFERNFVLAGMEVLPNDNWVETQSVSMRYIAFLDGCDYVKFVWFVILSGRYYGDCLNISQENERKPDMKAKLILLLARNAWWAVTKRGAL